MTNPPIRKQFKNFLKNKTKRKPARKYNLPMRISNRPVYTITTYNTLDNQIENDSIAFQKGFLNFTLDQAQGYSQYTAIFDQYRINWVKVEFVPVMTQAVNRPFDDTTTPLATQVIPRFIVAMDRDDVTNPTSYESLMVKRPNKEVLATQKLSWKFTPNRLVMMYRTGTTTGYKVDTQVNEFLDCAQTDIPHYGLKWAIEASSPTRGFIYETKVTYNISFRSKRQ